MLAPHPGRTSAAWDSTPRARATASRSRTVPSRSWSSAPSSAPTRPPGRVLDRRRRVRRGARRAAALARRRVAARRARRRRAPSDRAGWPVPFGERPIARRGLRPGHGSPKRACAELPTRLAGTVGTTPRPARHLLMRCQRLAATMFSFHTLRVAQLRRAAPGGSRCPTYLVPSAHAGRRMTRRDGVTGAITRVSACMR